MNPTKTAIKNLTLTAEAAGYATLAEAGRVTLIRTIGGPRACRTVFVYSQGWTVAKIAEWIAANPVPGATPGNTAVLVREKPVSGGFLRTYRVSTGKRLQVFAEGPLYRGGLFMAQVIEDGQRNDRTAGFGDTEADALTECLKKWAALPARTIANVVF